MTTEERLKLYRALERENRRRETFELWNRIAGSLAFGIIIIFIALVWTGVISI